MNKNFREVQSTGLNNETRTYRMFATDDDNTYCWWIGHTPNNYTAKYRAVNQSFYQEFVTDSISALAKKFNVSFATIKDELAKSKRS